MWWRQSTPLGDLVVVTNEHGVHAISFAAEPELGAVDEPPERDDDSRGELDEYFAGTRRSFTVHADLSYVDPDALRAPCPRDARARGPVG